MKKSKKITFILSMVISFILLIIGVSFAALGLSQTGTNKELIVGDIYMHYKENNQLVLSDTMPMDIDKYMGYQVNPVMATQEVVDNELTRCVNYLEGTRMPLSNGTMEEFCKGEGTAANDFTFQENLNNGDWFWEELITEMLSLNIIIKDGENYFVNSSMATQEVQKVNQLTRCVDILNEWGWGFDEGSDAESFCKGTGTFDGGITFQEELEAWILWAKSDSTIEEGFLNDGGQELLDAGVIIPKIIEYKKYSLNEEMTEGELNKCVTIFQDEFGWGKNDDETWESFCQGTGTSYGDSFLDYLNNNWFYAYQLNYLEQNNIIVVEKEDKLPYFEFTISGKNTYTKKDIYYEVILNHGTDHETRTTRIRDDLLRFSLVEIKNGIETLVINNYNYNDLTNKRIFTNVISKNTNKEVNATYRLYMWIDENTVIGNVDYDYTLEEWEDVFASIKVNVNGDFTEKEDKTLAYSYRKSLEEHKDAVYQSPIGTYLSGTSYKFEDREYPVIDFNYVWYSGRMWRIVAIYPDNTMKLVTDKVATNINFGENVHFYTNEEDNSYVYQWLNQEFLPTLYNYKNIIETNYKWDASPVSDNDDIPNKSEIVVSPVGLLNAYEFKKTMEYIYDDYQVGATYLNDYSGYGDFLLNPSDVDNIWYIDRGNIYSNYMFPLAGNVKPSIVLKASVEKLSGTGTQTDPYKIEGDISKNVINLNERNIGEYVNFDNELYRIVDIENGITKLNKVMYLTSYDQSNLVKTAASSKNYGDITNIQSDEYWDYYLNNTWYNSISSSYKNMMVKGTYYLNEVPSHDTYKYTICENPNSYISTKECNKTTNVWVGYVGLPREGEFINYITYNYIEIATITPNLIIGDSYYSSNTVAQPSITLSSNVVITSGSGMENDPFEIELSN